MKRVKQESNELKQKRMTNRRIGVIFMAIVSLLIILVLRLGYLQIVKGEAYRQAVDNNKIVASPFAYRTHDFYGKAHAPGVIAAPLVVTLVGARGEEFVD